MKHMFVASTALALLLAVPAFGAEQASGAAAQPTPTAAPSSPAVTTEATAATPAAAPAQPATSNMSTAQTCDIATVQQSADATTSATKKRKAYAEIKLAQSAQAKNDQASCQVHVQKAQNALTGA